MSRFQQTMRWFGPNDPFGLSDIRQAGCTGIVTALHEVPVGDLWTTDDIRARKSLIENAGLTWAVVESLPVHEDIKKRAPGYRSYIDKYKDSLRNLSACGIRIVTYNFMPVLDWVRTDVSVRLSDGSETLRFEKQALAAFDLRVLKRPDASADYLPDEISSARAYYDQLDDRGRRSLSEAILLGLPGGNDSFTIEHLLSSIKTYEGIDGDDLRENLVHFLREISPVADAEKIRLAIHPDDPPFPVLGLPRVVSTKQDLEYLFASVPNASNGLCFCTGSFGARADNDLPDIIKTFGDRIHFVHLRNTERDRLGGFQEAHHLSGDTDMARVVELLVRLMKQSGLALPMRPDHGHRILDDLNKQSYPGYSGLGRVKALAELRGLEHGLSRD